MAEADPLSAIVSPRFAFSDRGAPGDFNVGFRFSWSHLAVCYIPLLHRQGPVGPSPPFSSVSGPPADSPAYNSPDGSPARPFGALWECCCAACPHG
jgi:hypothetical protein